MLQMDENLPLYEKAFDIVLKDDQSMDIVLEILNPIL